MIGRIVGAHGVKGMVRVHPTTDYPERFNDMKTLSVERAGKRRADYQLLSVSRHDAKGQLLVRLSGIDDRDDAEALTGAAITVDPTERVELPEGEYWIDSLIGLDVIDHESGAHLGKVEDVMQAGNHDNYVVRDVNGGLKLIPAVAEIVKVIDTERGEMVVELIEGLWD